METGQKNMNGGFVYGGGYNQFQMDNFFLQKHFIDDFLLEIVILLDLRVNPKKRLDMN